MQGSAWGLGCEVRLGCKAELGLCCLTLLLFRASGVGCISICKMMLNKSQPPAVSELNYVFSKLLTLFLFSHSHRIWQVLQKVALYCRRTASTGNGQDAFGALAGVKSHCVCWGHHTW